jgi:hypothetical protein
LTAPHLPKHADGGCQAVRQNALAGDDAHHNAVGESETRDRIHDMRIALSVRIQVLFGIARGGHGGVVEFGYASLRINLNVPAFVSGRRV